MPLSEQSCSAKTFWEVFQRTYSRSCGRPTSSLQVIGLSPCSMHIFQTRFGIHILRELELTDLLCIKAATRDASFRAEVIQAYEHRCAVCGFDAKFGHSDFGLESLPIFAGIRQEDPQSYRMVSRFAFFITRHSIAVQLVSVQILHCLCRLTCMEQGCHAVVSEI